MRNSAVLILTLSLISVGCSRNAADLVVYGSVHTLEETLPVAEALAVKDGRYIYVGGKTGTESFIREGDTRVIDLTGKGEVVPGCPKSHALYLLSDAIKTIGGLSVNGSDEGVNFFLQKVRTAYERAKATGKASIFGIGWNYDKFVSEGMPTREQLDAICPDIALFVNDSECHRGLANTTCLRIAGIMDSTGKVLTDQTEEDGVCMDADGKPDGLLLGQAASFVRVRGIDFDDMASPEIAGDDVETFIQMILFSEESTPGRGSIMEGNYADFVLVDKDNIDSGKVMAAFFEGKEVYQIEDYQNLR